MSIVKVQDLSKINKRIIVIGDIHGCFDQLQNLLNSCNYLTDNDIIVCCGDLVDRGAESDKVLNFFMNNSNCYCVMGNHDQKFLRFLKGNKVSIAPGLQKTIFQTRHMDKSQLIDYLENLPYIIKLPDIDSKPVYVVHAGFAPGVPVKKQTKESCIYIRGINPKNYFDESNGLWYDYLEGSCIVFHGHIKEENIQSNPFVYHMDAGCVHGGKLRAAVIENGSVKILEVDGVKKEGTPSDPVEARDDLVENGLLRCNKSDRLKVYTYTDKCVFEKQWNKITLNSRGHIFNIDTSECVAFAMPKFFNLNETPETQENVLPWNEDFKVWEKLDGWLGVLYRQNGQFKIATRGSFYSDGAHWATKFLNENYNLSNLPNNVTLIFEIISPVTEIVVDYKGAMDLVLITAYDRFQQKELTKEEINEIPALYGFPRPEQYNFKSLAEIKSFVNALKGNEQEGVVVQFNNGLRVKIKSQDYLRRSKLMQSITPLNVWEIINNKQNPEDFIKDMPKEYKEMFYDIHNKLLTRKKSIKKEIENEFNLIKQNNPKNRKEVSELISKLHIINVPAMFSMYDNNEDKTHKYILKLIKPKNNIIKEE